MSEFDPDPLRSMPVCLTVSSMDSTGGAVAQADLKTFTALGTYGAGVITSLVAQGFTRTCDEIPIRDAFVREQLESVDEALEINAVKVGHCPTSGIIRIVGRWLRQRKGIPVVIDPVMVTKAGIPLQQPEVIVAMQEELLPIATVITPNRFEAAQLTGKEEVLSREDMAAAAEQLFETYGCPTVVTGGGLTDENIDVFHGIDGGCEFPAAVIERGVKPFGAGDTYSAALCALLARANDLRESMMAAKSYVRSLIAESPIIARRKAGSQGSPNPISHCIAVDSLARADGMGATATGIYRALGDRDR